MLLMKKKKKKKIIDRSMKFKISILKDNEYIKSKKTSRRSNPLTNKVMEER